MIQVSNFTLTDEHTCTNTNIAHERKSWTVDVHLTLTRAVAIQLCRYVTFNTMQTYRKETEVR